MERGQLAKIKELITDIGCALLVTVFLPSIANALPILNWQDDQGNVISRIKIDPDQTGKKVNLVASDLPFKDCTNMTFNIWEWDGIFPNDHITDIDGHVQNGKATVSWEASVIPDQADGPEFFFKVEVPIDSKKITLGPSGILYVSNRKKVTIETNKDFQVGSKEGEAPVYAGWKSKQTVTYEDPPGDPPINVYLEIIQYEPFDPGWDINLSPSDLTLSEGESKDFYLEVNAVPSYFSDVKFQILARTNTNINEWDITDPISVYTPEPSTMLLLGSGLAGLVGFGRKRLLGKRKNV